MLYSKCLICLKTIGIPPQRFQFYIHISMCVCICKSCKCFGHMIEGGGPICVQQSAKALTKKRAWSNNKTTLLICSHWQVPSDINVYDSHSSCTKKAKHSSRFQAWTTMKSKGVYCGYQVASQTHKANVQNNTKLQTQA